LRVAGVENVIVSFHGWDEPVERRIANSRLLLAIFRYLFGYARHTLVLAEAFRDWLVNVAGLERNRVHLFTTMFDDAEFRAVGDVIAHDDNSVLFLSRLVREKGIYELIDAFRMLAVDYPDLRLVIAGNGPEEDRLRTRVAEAGMGDKVSFTGYVRGADKVRVLQAAGLFVFPTYYGEGCPVSLLEAMAAGLPLVTSRAGGITHIVKEPENGLLLGNVTPKDIESAMRQLLDDNPLRESMRSTNMREAWECYSAPVVTRLFEKLYSGAGEVANGG